MLFHVGTLGIANPFIDRYAERQTNYHRALGRVSHDKTDDILTLLLEDRSIRLASPIQKKNCQSTTRNDDELLIATHTRSSHDTRSLRGAKKKRLYKSSAIIGTISISTTSDNSSFVAIAVPPPWLRSLLAWSLTVSHHLQQFNIRYYNTRPNTSDIFTRVKSKDLSGMLHLFQNRCASPFDRDEDGLTLLHVST